MNDITDILKDCLLAGFTVVIALLIQIGVLIYGWGLIPKDWWWIVGINLLGQLFVGFLVAIIKKKN
jgi:RsiW-degrading membrane proteinase PrsW (M82 family)